MNRAWISQSGLYDNIARIRRMVPTGCRVAAVIKGDAYGHGLDVVAVAMEMCPDIDMLVVSSLEEAMSVLGAVVRKPILILNRVFSDTIDEALMRLEEEERIRFIRQCIFSAYRWEDIVSMQRLSGKYGQAFSLHVRLDFSSGMRGMNRQQFAKFQELVYGISDVNIGGLYAHVYSAYTDDTAAARDIREYAAIFDAIPEKIRRKFVIHLLSSVSFYRFPEACYDMVRIGAIMYGLPVEEEEEDPHFPPAPKVEPVMSIRAEVVNIADVGQGSRVDYDGYLPSEVERVALVSMGNWDIPGFFTTRANRTGKQEYPISGDISGRCVRIREHLCRVVGSPCMDTFCVDISGLSDVAPGDEVRILGNEEGIRLEDWLRHAGLDFGNCQMLFSGMGRLVKQLH